VDVPFNDMEPSDGTRAGEENPVPQAKQAVRRSGVGLEVILGAPLIVDRGVRCPPVSLNRILRCGRRTKARAPILGVDWEAAVASSFD